MLSSLILWISIQASRKPSTLLVSRPSINLEHVALIINCGDLTIHVTAIPPDEPIHFQRNTEDVRFLFVHFEGNDGYVETIGRKCYVYMQWIPVRHQAHDKTPRLPRSALGCHPHRGTGGSFPYGDLMFPLNTSWNSRAEYCKVIHEAQLI